MLERIAHMRFAYPQYLLLLAVLPVMFWMGRRSMAGLAKARARTALLVRMFVVLALCMALAKAQYVRIRDDMAVAFVIDKSLSVPTADQEELLNQVHRWQTSSERGAKDKVALVTFGGNAAIDQPFTDDLLDTTTSFAMVDGGHTDIASAIRAAIAAMPEAGRKRIVLMTDGNENDGAASSEAASAKAAGVRVDCLPVRYEHAREVMVEKVIAPAEVAPGKTISIRVLVRTFNKTTGTLRLSANDALIASKKVNLKPGINAFSVERQLPESGVYDFKAWIEAEDDTMYQNNSATAYSVVRGPKKVLVVEGTRDDGAMLADALRGGKVGVDLVLPSMLPNSVALLSRYDTIVLVNVAAFDLPEETIELLETAVNDYGLGLIMVGGEDSFGAGGWKGTPVEKAMPVSMDVKDRQVIPTGALVIINHTCEFADGNRWGINIAKAALNTLGRYDEYGLLYYDYQGGEQWLIPLQPVTNQEAMKAQIEKMSAGDMPSFDATMRMAQAALAKSKASVKHMIIISDGDPSVPPVAFLQSMAASGITVSTVAIQPHGGQSVGSMRNIATICNGRFYYPRSPAQLPQIFIKEARTVRRGLISEQPFTPRMVAPSVPLNGFEGGVFPMLKGYVITTPKPRAEMPLVTAGLDPLLAHWQYGLGRAAAFTSDAKPKWAADWVTWERYVAFWGQLVEWAERKVEMGDFSTSVSLQGNVAKISVDAIDKNGDFVNFLQFAGTVLSPKGEKNNIVLEQTAPGHYEGSFKATEVGTYMPLLKYDDAEGKARTYMLPVTIPFSEEYRALSTNDVLLKEMSEIADGAIINHKTNVFREDFAAAASYVDVWQWILAAGIVLFLVDVFVRRVLVDWAKLLAAIQGAPARARVQTHTARLLSAKSRATGSTRAAARKFDAEAAPEASVMEDIIQEQTVARARAAAQKRPDATPLAEVARDKPKEEDGYTSRLLKAKRRARKDGGTTRQN